MPQDTPESARSSSSIIDNLGENTLLHALVRRTEDGRELCIATAFFSLDAFNALGPSLMDYDRIRLLFGDDASKSHRKALINALRARSDIDLRERRRVEPIFRGLEAAMQLIASGKFEARCYTAAKFHAKAYLVDLDRHPEQFGVIGSGNFTRQGLCHNLELNVDLTTEQCNNLRDWYEARWLESKGDVATEDLQLEILRQIQLYDPYAIFLRTLMEWGRWVRSDDLPPAKIVEMLDAHQLSAVREGTKILEREHALMICDGVGLGKSFIALALMELALREDKKVLLIAPKSIMSASWHYYLKKHLSKYNRNFKVLHELEMTWFRFEPAGSEIEEAEYAAKLQARNRQHQLQTRQQQIKDLIGWGEQSQLVVIDESHNFRTSGANQYINLLQMLAARTGEKRPDVIMLTATPVNTQYADLTNQFRLLCNRSGKVDREDRSLIASTPLAQVIAEANRLDRELRERRRTDDQPIQASLFGDEKAKHIIETMQAIAIQRSRATCVKQARDADRELRFPKRIGPIAVPYELSPLYEDLVEHVNREFTELAKYLARYRQEIIRASNKKQKKIDRKNVALPMRGLRLSAYQPDRYTKRSFEKDSLYEANSEALLATLVFANVMKQLESSPPAFIGILRSLGAGLCARLLTAFPTDTKAIEFVEEHKAWINRSVRYDDTTHYSDPEADDDSPEAEDENAVGEDDAASETSTGVDRVERARRGPSVRHALLDFGPDTHDVKRWRNHLEGDLNILEEIHQRAVQARSEAEDRKLIILAEHIKQHTVNGERALVFTQSVRTSEYLQDKLPEFLRGKKVARIDANVTGDARAKLLHGFAPLYNQGHGDPEIVDILVCTDVLSEGVNLQQAGLIVNYDLHWNPTRLIQRIGRVDRRLRDDDLGDRSFQMINVLPPKPIEEIIKLVRSVEGRVAAINAVVGIDQAFFKSEDEGGTLKEFNAMIDGTVSKREILLSMFEATRRKDQALPAITPAQIEIANQVPDGAFGVWEGSGETGGFALFTVYLDENALEADRTAYKRLIGQPVAVLLRDHTPVETDIVRILSVLMEIDPDWKSGTPSEEATLRRLIARLCEEAFESLPHVSKSVKLKLVVWMELQP